MASDDIYRYALDKFAPIDDEDDVEELDENKIDTEGERKYTHLKFKAHYDDRCNHLHKPSDVAYPEGCLLYPRRLPWRRIRHIKAQTPDR